MKIQYFLFRKKTWIFLFILFSVIFHQNIYAQSIKNANNNSQESKQESLSNVSMSCKECKEIVDLFHDAFIKGISINSIDFFPMKALVENCNQDNSKECGGKMEKELNLLSGNLDGGPSSYGEDSRWRIPSTTDFTKLKISKNEAINNFKKSYTEKLIKDCSECSEIVERFYDSFVNKTYINDIEFNLLKSKVQNCMSQKSSECGSKMEKQLAILSGNLEGGPTSYGDDSKWRIANKVWKFDSDSDFKNISTLSSKDIIFKYKNLYGVKDKEGLVFIYPKYEKIEEIKFNNSEYLIVTLEKKKGIIDVFGNLILPIEYKKILSNPKNPKSLIFETLDKKQGIVYGDFVKKEIDCQSLFFSEKFCAIVKNDKIGFLDEIGNIKIEPKYDDIGFLEYKYFTSDNVRFSSGGGSSSINYIPSDNVLIVKKENKLGLIGGEQLKEILLPNYEKIGYSTIDKDVIPLDCVSGLIPIWENGKMGYVNERGNMLILPKYDKIIGFGIKGVVQDKISFVKLDNKWGIFSNKDLQELTPIQYDDITFVNELAQVKIGDKYGVVDINGKEIVKPQYEKIIGLDTNNRYLILQNGGFYGLVKNDGTVITPVIYQSIENNLAFWNVKRENKIGLIDESGNWIIQPKYQEIGKFNNGLASIKFNGKYGMLSEQGYETIKPMYDYPFEFTNDYANVSYNGKSFRIDAKGEKVINNFTNSSLSSLTIEGRSVSDVLTKKIDDMYTKAASNIIYSKALGKKYNFDLDVKNSISAIKSEVEGWLGGQMTANQLNEFNQIKNASESRTTSAMRAMSEVMKIDNENKQNKSKGSVHRCAWCSRGFQGGGYLLWGDKIEEGGKRWTELGTYYRQGDYCSRKCANDAYWSQK